MTRHHVLALTVTVVVALAAAPAVEAQAQRRGGSDSGSSSGGASGGGEGGSAMPRHTPPAPSPAPPSTVRERPSQPAGVGSPRTSAVRPASAGSSPRVSPANRGTSESAASADMRLRSVQAVRGVAQPRRNVVTPAPRPSWDGWDRWSPWYGYGLGYSYGYYPYYGPVVYSPWGYGGSPWSWNRYRWHDPFLYDPYGYVAVPYYWPSSASSWDDTSRDQGVPTGSIRLRVNPSTARVYIDGALAGVASEFGGLSNHLVLPAGMHELELRADGYATYTGQIDVRDGRTRTERVNLERQ